jgi:hypothetical protein
MASSPRTPEWVKHAVFYQIFPDRFARSERVPKATHLEPWDAPPTVHGYKGGDLLGVVERLDHLQSLGVTALYFNPIFQSGANHRYHTHDYFRVDPMLGGDAALRELLDAAHARGMRVVLDGVFNHASRGFLQFHDVLENGPASAYLDWWHIEGFPLGAYGEGDGALRYRAWWDLPALPKFDTDTPAVREFLLSVGEHWLRFGVDGWRLDVPNEIDDDDFWREFRRRCRAVNPEAYIVGELWTGAERWLQGDQFDAVMNYQVTKAVLGFVAAEIDDAEVARCGYGAVPRLSAQAFQKAIGAELSRYHPEITRRSSTWSARTTRRVRSPCSAATATRCGWRTRCSSCCPARPACTTATSSAWRVVTTPPVARACRGTPPVRGTARRCAGCRTWRRCATPTRRCAPAAPRWSTRITAWSCCGAGSPATTCSWSSTPTAIRPTTSRSRGSATASASGCSARARRASRAGACTRGCRRDAWECSRSSPVEARPALGRPSVGQRVAVSCSVVMQV